MGADALELHLAELHESKPTGSEPGAAEADGKGKKGLSNRSINARLVAWRSFCRWCVAVWIADKPVDEPLWSLPDKPVELLKSDLAAAEVPYIDADGFHRDLHSLRHGYVSRLVRAGVPIKTVQALAGHASAVTTLAVYAHVGIVDDRRAVSSPAAAATARGRRMTLSCRNIATRIARRRPSHGGGLGKDRAGRLSARSVGCISSSGCASGTTDELTSTRRS